MKNIRQFIISFYKMKYCVSSVYMFLLKRNVYKLFCFHTIAPLKHDLMHKSFVDDEALNHEIKTLKTFLHTKSRFDIEQEFIKVQHTRSPYAHTLHAHLKNTRRFSFHNLLWYWLYLVFALFMIYYYNGHESLFVAWLSILIKLTTIILISACYAIIILSIPYDCTLGQSFGPVYPHISKVIHEMMNIYQSE